MHSKISWLVVITLACLAGCSTTHQASQADAPAGVSPSVLAADKCVFPGTSDSAPSWVCDAPVEGLALSAPGVAEKTNAGYPFMKDMATLDARKQLADRVKVRITRMVKQYAETVGAGRAESIDRVNTSVTRQITDQTLVGSYVVRTMTGPDGRLWTLVGLDAASLEKITRTSIEASAQHDAQEWQRIRGQQSTAEMVDAIAGQHVQTQQDTGVAKQ